MAKIENTQAYPTVTPSMEDLLIATDVSNNNETVTFLVSDLIGGAGVLQGLQSVLDVGNTATQNMTLTGVGPGGGITVIGTIYPTTITAGGSIGAAGQILSSTGTGIEWINSPATSCCSWNDTLSINNTAIQKAVVDGATFSVINAGGNIEILNPAFLQVTGLSTFSNTVSVNSTSINFNATGQINDGAGSTGAVGQFLTSTGTGLAWSSTLPPGSCCSLQDTIAAGNTSNNQSVNLTGSGTWLFGANVLIDSSGNNEWKGNNNYSATGTTASTSAINLNGSLYDGVSTGAAGQILSSSVTGVQWIDPSVGQTLQDVLDLGNSATGVNASITISGTLNAGSITDSSLSTGGPNQYLTAGPGGGSLVWTNAPGCCDLADTLAVGNTASQNIILSGAGVYVSAPLMIPTQIQDGTGGLGTAGQVLTSTGTGIEWTTAPAAGVSSVTGTLGSSAGLPLNIAPTTGAVIIQSNAYTGGTNVGHVPSGGTASTFLRGDGTWQVPAGAGVTTLTTVDGTFIDLTPNAPTAGAVTVTADLSATGTPSATTFLRGDNTWAVPAGGSTTAPEEVVRVPFFNQKWEPGALGASDYYTFDGLTQGPGNLQYLGNNNIGSAAPPGTPVAAEDYLAGIIWGFPHAGTCTLYGTGWSVCSVKFQIISDTNTTFIFNLYKGPLCPEDPEVSTMQLLATCEILEVTPGMIACCEATIEGAPVSIIGHNEAIFMTLNNGGAGGANVTFQGNVFMNLQKHTP